MLNEEATNSEIVTALIGRIPLLLMFGGEGGSSQLTLNKTQNVTVQVVLKILQYRRINTQMQYNPTIQTNTTGYP